MDDDRRNDTLLRAVYSASLICPLSALLRGTPWASIGVLNWQNLLEMAGSCQTDAELLERALVASGCLQSVVSVTDSYQVDGACAASLLASVANNTDVLVELLSVAKAVSVAEQVSPSPVAEWLSSAFTGRSATVVISPNYLAYALYSIPSLAALQAFTLQALVEACAHLQHLPLHLACAVLVVMQQCQSHTGSQDLVAEFDKAAHLAARCCQDVAIHLSARSTVPGIGESVRKNHTYSALDVAEALDGEKSVLLGLWPLFADIIARLPCASNDGDDTDDFTCPFATAILPAEFGACWTDCSNKVRPDEILLFVKSWM